MKMSSHERFQVVYDGPPLSTDHVEVRDLAPATVVSTVILRRLLIVKSRCIKEGNKLYVHDGDIAFYVSVDDKTFLTEIDSGKRLAKGDVLLADLRQIQTVLGAKLATESLIVKVLEHRQSLQQSLL